MSETEKKQRFAVGRKSGDSFYLDYSQVFYDLERVTAFAKVRNEKSWAVFELDSRGIGFATNPILLPYAITCGASRNGAIEELIYEARANARAAIEGRVNQSDDIYYMTVIDYANKEEEKEDFAVAFYVADNEWVYEGKSVYTDQKLGWVGSEYVVKIGLPKNAVKVEVSNAN